MKVVVSVGNFIWPHGIHRHQFQSLLSEADAEYEDVLYGWVMGQYWNVPAALELWIEMLINEEGKAGAKWWKVALVFGIAIWYEPPLKWLIYQTSRSTESNFWHAWSCKSFTNEADYFRNSWEMLTYVTFAFCDLCTSWGWISKCRLPSACAVGVIPWLIFLKWDSVTFIAMLEKPPSIEVSDASEKKKLWLIELQHDSVVCSNVSQGAYASSQVGLSQFSALANNFGTCIW